MRDLSVVTSLRYEIVNDADGVTRNENFIQEAETSGNSGLRYDETNEQFIYVWKTNKSLAGETIEFVLGLSDGSEHRASFDLR